MTFTDRSEGVDGERRWSFPGGSPATAVGSTAIVRWPAPGSYAVQLAIEGSDRSPPSRLVPIGLPALPGILGRPVGASADVLDRAGLQMGDRRDVPSLQPAGTVVAASHNGVPLTKGDRVEVGWVIDIDVSDGTKPVVRVSTAYDHACAVTIDGAVACWGSNLSGELGDGTTDDSHSPVTVEGLRPAVAVATGAQTTCALLRDRTVACWGDNEFGSLGNGTMTDSRRPVRVIGIDDAVQVATNGVTACVVRSTGSVWCWGKLSAGDAEPRSPRPVAIGIEGAVEVSLGVPVYCARLLSGTVSCWGGSLDDDGNLIWVDSPTPLSGIDDARAVAVGLMRVCVLHASRAVSCRGFEGQPSGSYTHGQVEVPGADRVEQLSGTYGRNCVLLTGGTVKCWGATIAISPSFSNLPTSVQGVSRARYLDSGASQTCAVLDDQSLWCWGPSRLADATPGMRDAPTRVKVF